MIKSNFTGASQGETMQTQQKLSLIGEGIGNDFCL
jgi:hypothetical protein